MRNLIMVCLAVILPGLIANSAQTKEAMLDGIVRAMAEKEPEWQGGKVHSMPGTPDPDRPQGTVHDFEWKRKDRTATLARLHIFYGDSKEDAVRMLDWSQMMLSINESEPLENIGERAYQYAKNGNSWLTFRKGNVFAQVNVSLVDLRTADKAALHMLDLTVEARETAKRFAQHVANQI